MTSSNPNHLPKVSPPNTITLGVRVSTWEFGSGGIGWGDTHIQSITLADIPQLSGFHEDRVQQLPQVIFPQRRKRGFVKSFTLRVSTVPVLHVIRLI